MADVIYDNTPSTVDVVLINNPPDIINNDSIIFNIQGRNKNGTIIF
ncbi:MAG: hypothetical protein WC679_00065 [Bacteroidales bacterium]|jgi:hypothetical protein